ncbi:MAG: iron-sulfur cluster assembly scaffold protein [Dehalococcoidia bacterium]
MTSQEQINIHDIEEAQTEQVREYLDSPKNVEIMLDYDGEGEISASSKAWRATLWIYVKVRNGKIWKASWFATTMGGLISAYGSALTEMVKGKTIQQALAIQPKDISGALGLPETGFGAWFKRGLVEAINNYNAYKLSPWKRTYEPR